MNVINSNHKARCCSWSHVYVHVWNHTVVTNCIPLILFRFPDPSFPFPSSPFPAYYTNYQTEGSGARLYTHILHELLVGVATGIGWARHELLVILSINYWQCSQDAAQQCKWLKTANLIQLIKYTCDFWSLLTPVKLPQQAKGANLAKK